MINIPPIKQSSNIKAEVIPELTRTWKVGQILNATTQRGGKALSEVLLQVGQYTLTTKTPVALQTGQEVKLLIKSLETPQSDSTQLRLPLLSIVEIKPATTRTGELIALKLRQFIAVQQSFTQLQHTAVKLLTAPQVDRQADTHLSTTLKTLLSNLQQSIQINSHSIQPAQLKQQLLNSGIFYESKILNATTKDNATGTISSKLNRDFKFQLLSLKAELAKLVPAQDSSQPVKLNTQQLQTLQSAIKQSASNFNPNKVSELAGQLLSLLPKTSLTQLVNLLNGQGADTTSSNETQSLAKLLNISLQQAGSQPKVQLLAELEFHLQMLELSQQVDQSISKITSLQLQPLLQASGKESDNLVLLLFNLMFKDAREHFDIDFRIQQDEKKHDPADESWTLTLSFNFKRLGKVQSKVHLLGDQISSVFYAELSTTADKIQTLLPLLESALTEAGLIVNNLAVENRLLNNRPFISKQVNLLDENA